MINSEKISLSFALHITQDHRAHLQRQVLREERWWSRFGKGTETGAVAEKNSSARVLREERRQSRIHLAGVLREERWQSRTHLTGAPY